MQEAKKEIKLGEASKEIKKEIKLGEASTEIKKEAQQATRKGIGRVTQKEPQQEAQKGIGQGTRKAIEREAQQATRKGIGRVTQKEAKKEAQQETRKAAEQEMGKEMGQGTREASAREGKQPSGKERGLLEDLIIRYPLLQGQREDIWDAFAAMAESFAKGGKLLVAGNGGSAADAEHIVGELMKGFAKPRVLDEATACHMEGLAPGKGREIAGKLQQALPAIALAGHTALTTAYANDVDPVLGYAQQVYGYGREGDVLLGISTSGNSENIWNACIVAKAKGMRVVGLTGHSGGRLRGVSDVLVAVPGEKVHEIQELHLPVYHCICLMLEEYFF